MATALWWVGVALLYLVVIPLVALLAHRLLRPLREIKRYSDDIRSGVARVGSNVAAVGALVETRERLERVGPAVAGAAGKPRGFPS